MNLSESWERLEQDTRIPDESQRVQRRIGSAGRRDFFLGLEMPSRNRMLILRVNADSVDPQPNMPNTRGLTVRVILRDPSSGQAEVQLVLIDSQHRDIFDLLVRDLVDAGEQGATEREGVIRFLARLSAWQQLLRRLEQRGLSREGQQGLWGELWVLRDVVAPAMGVELAVQGWRGPVGADQDFQVDTTCIEVKTSSANSLDQLSISSEVQLEAPQDVTLLLVGLSLDARPGHGQTLPEIVEEARARASDHGCLQLLDARLQLSGYDNGDSNLYADIGYTTRSVHAFRVAEGFPRIASSDLPDGIAHVRYHVALAACEPFRLDAGSPADLLRGLA